MKEFDLSVLPTAVDVTLFKYNYIDNKVWTQILDQLDYIDLGKDMLMVSGDQLHALLEKNYLNDINKIKSVGSDVFHKEVNSVFFLYQILIEMCNLKYIKLNLNKNKAYTRMSDVGGNKLLKFDFKVLSATLNVFDIYEKSEMPIVNKYLSKIGIFKNSEPYVRIQAKDLADKIDDFMSLNPDDKDAGILMDILDVLEPKLEQDNSITLFITDY